MFKIKKEVGIAEIISFFALVMSGVAIWFSYQSNEAFIVQGGGLIQTSTIKDYKTGQCNFVLAMPITFHNSGKKAVSLKQLAPSDDLDSIFFASGKSLIPAKNIKFKQYLSFTGIGAVSSMWLSQVTSGGEFKPSYNHIDDLIRPNETYQFYRVVVIDSVNELKQLETPRVFLSLNAIFSNDQVQSVNSAINLDLSVNQQCS
ncbi:hypothetical protein [Vibrio splendidus]|uniref:hypothetical protein n=1 Tax=Vibrio splendidus TaxID=29497 RepID=UPI000C82948E|nr:hypothetical protein [Vibrio splendidus]PMO69129.1 hypothetical protein BCT03_24230 [Vibrio splendidus]